MSGSERVKGHGVENGVLQQVEIGGRVLDQMGIFKPPIERIFTNGERLRRRISSSALFVLIRDIRGSNGQRLKKVWTEFTEL
jgi:hypothetical protein